MNTIDIIDQPEDFAALRAEWTKLLASSRANCIFLTWEWLHAWWTHFRENRQLFIVTVRRGGELLAIVPLTVRRVLPFQNAVLEFAGTGSVGSDYLDFIIDSRYESAAIEALTEFFSNRPLSLRLPSVTENSTIASKFVPQLLQQGWLSRRVVMQECPYIDLSGKSFEEYLAGVSASHRYNFRRRLRNLQKAHSVDFHQAANDTERRRALSQVIGMHLRRWEHRGGSDAFHRRALVEFHEDFSAMAQDRGWLRLNVLSIDARPASAFYGFRYADKYSFYQSGFDEAFARDSVGLITLGLTIKQAAEERACEYDFLHGDESYKFLWTKQVRPLYRYELYPPGISGRVHRQSVSAVATTKNVLKRALRSKKTLECFEQS